MCSTCQPFELPRATLARTARWSQALQLPSNRAAFQTLMLQKPPANLYHVVDEAVGPYFTTLKAQRVLHRVWGFLLVHEPGLASVPIAPYAAAMGALAFPTSPVFAFELALNFLINTAPYIYNAECLHSLDTALRKRSPTLHQHLAAIGCRPQQYLGVPLERCFLGCFNGEPEWTKFADSIFTAMDGDAEYCRAAVAVVEANAKLIMKCQSPSDVLRLLNERSLPFEAIKSRLLTLRQTVRVPLGERRAVVNGDGSRYLPLLHFIDSPIAASSEPQVDIVTVAVLDRMLKHEEELLREKENRLRLLEYSLADARRNLNPTVLGGTRPAPTDHNVWLPLTDGFSKGPHRGGRDDDDDGGHPDGRQTPNRQRPGHAEVFPGVLPEQRSPTSPAAQTAGVARPASSLDAPPTAIVDSPNPVVVVLASPSPSPAAGRISVVPIFSVRSTPSVVDPAVYSTPRDKSASSKFLDSSAQRSSLLSTGPRRPASSHTTPVRSTASSTQMPTRWSASVSSSKTHSTNV